MVAALAVKKGGLRTQEEVADEEELQRKGLVVAGKLSHFPAKKQRKMEEMLHKVDILAWSLHDLRTADDPVQHTIEPTDDKPIYQRPRRLPLNPNQIIGKEIRKISDADVIVPARSAWSFPVVMATNNDEKQSFWVDYRLLNLKNKADR